MNTQEKVIAILAATYDGDDLHQHQVTLCRAALNDSPNPDTAAAVDALHQQIVQGEFQGRHNWFHGVRHLTKNGMGYVFWRDRNVEHFSFGDRHEEERAAAVELRKTCEMLEEKGFPVTSCAVFNRETFRDAPKGTPWLTALLSFYCFFSDGQNKPACAVFGLPEYAAVAVEPNGSTTTLRYAQEDDSAYGICLMFAQLQNEGYTPCTPKVRTYEALVGMFTEIGIDPAQIDGIISLGCPVSETAVPLEGVAQ